MNNVKFSIVIVLLFCFLNTSFAKEFAGKVVDKKTGEAVPYASISIPSLYKSFGCDSNGYFIGNIDKVKLPFFYKVSASGYQNIMDTVFDYSQDKLEIKLNPIMRMIDTVLVKAKTALNYDANDIVRRAIKNIKINYPSTPYILEGVFHNTIKDYNTNQTLDTYSEKVIVRSKKFTDKVEQKDISFSVPFDSTNVWRRMRYDNKDAILPQYTFPDFDNNPLLFLLRMNPIANQSRKTFDFVQRLDDEFLKNHRFSKVEKKLYNYENAYYIFFFPKYELVYQYLDPMNRYYLGEDVMIMFHNKQRYATDARLGLMVINKSDYAILRFEYHNGNLNDRYKFIAEFKRFDDYYYPTELYFGNKCMVNTNGQFVKNGNQKVENVTCKKSFDYIDEVCSIIKKQNPNNNQFIKKTIANNRVHTPNLIFPYYLNVPQKLKEIHAWGLIMEQLTDSFLTHNYQKIVHHRDFVITKISQQSPFDDSKYVDVPLNDGYLGFRNPVYYLGDLNCKWFFNGSSQTPISTLDYFPAKMSSSPKVWDYYFPYFPIPITSVDELRYVDKTNIKHLTFLTPDTQRIKGMTGYLISFHRKELRTNMDNTQESISTLPNRDPIRKDITVAEFLENTKYERKRIK